MSREQERDAVTFFVADVLVPRWASFPDRYKAAYAERALQFFDLAPRYPTAISGGRSYSVDLSSGARGILSRIMLAYGEAASTVLTSAVNDMLLANPEAKTLKEFVGYGR